MKTFNEAYNDVFDINGEIMACGRDKCKELIHIANKIEPNISHGDIENGYMNVESIKALYNKENNI